MPRPLINRVHSENERTLPIFDEIEQLQERIREHARKIYRGRGREDGHELHDWLEAEKQVCGSVSELVEEEHRYILKIALAGFEPDDIDITATPQELIVKAKTSSRTEDKDETSTTSVRWSDFHSTDIFRRVELPIAVDVDQISAKFERGLLTIEAPKALEPTPKSKKKVETTSA